MEEMTEKEAREILDVKNINKFTVAQIGKAIGYTDRLSQEKRIFGPLVEALEKIKLREQYSCECIGEECSCDFSYMKYIADNSLETFYMENPSWKK